MKKQLIMLLMAALAAAQEYRATLTGRVVDPQSAVIPGAKVVVSNLETGARSETVTAGDGQYTLPFLAPGPYKVTAEAAGFKRYARERMDISTGERVPLDISLEVGQQTETVTVSAETTLLETATASSGQVITARQIENMPMNGRTPLVLAQLAFGVVPSSDPRFYRPFDNAGPSDFSMGGAPARTNELLLDGAPDTTGNSRVAYNPPVDSVDEVKVESFQADAAYGHTQGGTVNVVLKGGTNSLHGSAYDFNQVSRLAATPFFTNRAGQTKPVTRYNQWGAGAGGPVMIPKVFDGRNKLFFYFAYEGIKDSFPEPLTQTVPTAAERGGDFSQLLTAGANYQLYDPLTGAREGSRVRRQPFTGNLIPANRLSSIARNYMQFYPLPNQTGRADGQDNYLANSVRSDDYNSELGRIDFVASERHKFFYNFRHNERLENRGNVFFNLATGNFLKRINWGSMFDDVYTFNLTTVLNVRLNWTRFTEGSTRPSDGYTFTGLGFPASVAAASPKQVLPRIDLDRFTDVGDSGGDNTPFDIFQIFVNLTKIRGKHSLKIGTDLRLHRESSISYGNSSGAYTFRSDWTRGPLDNSTGAPLGQDLAAFLLGLPTGGSFDLNAYRTNQAGYYALFLQDDFRVRPSLTLNLGLRYERDLPTTERYDRAVNGFDSTAASPVAAQAMAAYARNPIPELPVAQFRPTGGLLFAGPGKRDVYQPHANYFSPRFGFAWTPAALGGKTAIRGGAGVFFASYGTTGIFALGFSQSTPVVHTLDGLLTPNATLANPFPTGIQRPTGSTLGLSTFLGRDVDYPVSEPLNPYSARWNLSVQRQMGKNMVLEVGYTGNHAVHLGVDRDLRNVPRNFLSTRPDRDQAVIDRLTANVANPFAGLIPGTGLDGSTIQRQNLLVPFPQFTRVRARQPNDGNSYFHMLDVRLEKRYSQGVTFLANYAWSKLLQRRNRLNAVDDFLEKRIANEDRPHRLVFSTSYDLPFGKGKLLGSSAGPFWNRVIGGWVVNGIYTVQPGGPLGDWGNVIYLGGNLNLDPRRIDGAFDVTRFNRNSAQQLASNIRTFPTRFSTLRADGANNVDFSVIKNTPIREKLNLQYRCEFFNAMNHPTFNGPELSPTNSNFGRITSQANLSRSIQMALRLVW
ncbi:MAG: TonB-dependent receptor [Acidobacteria bacterium]|nr:TonB-dependent receptor [Acidobacteriota bacterium]